MTWTNEQVEQLRQMVADGVRPSTIGGFFGCSRNAVIGLMLRRGIKSHYAQGDRGARARPKVKPQRTTRFQPPALVQAQPMPEPAPPVVAPESQRCTIWQLTAETCRWPHGTPGQQDFYFCGGLPLAGSPYCGHHSQIAWGRS